jgi:Brp/Blh family beta-carotene 15,15'-monooxygenase
MVMTKTIGQKKQFAILSWLNVGVGILLLLAQLVYGHLPLSIQFGYFVLMLLMTGIPHGGLDHVIAKTTANVNKKQFKIWVFLSRYLFAIAAYSLCWFTLPSFSLLLFIIISAWHFGETDIANHKHKSLLSLCRFLWGTMVLMLILLMHKEETTEVLIRISKNAQPVMAFWTACKVYSNSILITLILTNTFLLTYAYLTKQLIFSFSKMLNLLLILAISIYLPLLPSFALYFGGWHAVRSFELIFDYLHTKDNFSGESPIKMWIRSLPMSIMAALGFLGLFIYWNQVRFTWDPLPVIFIFLSVITLPHLDVMDQMIRKDFKTSD